MDWVKVSTRLPGNRDFAVAKNEDVGAWLRLLVYCAQQENLGRIEKARGIDAETWPHLARVSLAEVNRVVAAGLGYWQGDDLLIAWYDSDGQRRCESNRRQAHDAGKKSGESRRLNQSVQPTVVPNVEHGRTDGHTEIASTWKLCGFHDRGKNQNRRASALDKECAECKHVAALKSTRNGGTKTIATILPKVGT